MVTKPYLIERGGAAFLITAAVGRMPAAMIQLGLLMYVASSGLGLDLGGLTVAAVGIGTAFSATTVGRLVDRFGPIPVIAFATIIQVITMAAIWSITPNLIAGTLPRGLLLGFAVVCGAANPQIGPIARSHWSHLSRDLAEPRLIREALGYEGAMDEASFIVGPIIAGLLVSLLGPTVALPTLMGIVVLGQGVFLIYVVVDRSRWHRRTVALADGHNPTIPVRKLLHPGIVALSTGMIFGATQTTLTAVNAATGTEHLTGIIYGSVGIGSAISSMLVVRVPPRVKAVPRLAVGAIFLILGGVGFMMQPGLIASLIVAIGLGIGVGIVLVTSVSIAERVAPSERIATVMTLLTMCLTLGVSLGAAVAGMLASAVGEGFYLVIGAGCVVLVSSLLASRTGDANPADDS